MDLTNKVALVTGATMGIGAAIAVELAKRGAHISTMARQLEGPGGELRARINMLDRGCHLMQGDLSQAASCTQAVEETVEKLGRLDILIHNAGGPAFGKIEDITPDVWQHTLDLHVTANYHLCRAALPHLRSAGGGVIITVASSAAIRGIPGAIAYATAKGALLNFTRCLARDLADDNIRVNCIAPGVIRTRFHKDMPEDRKQHNLDHRIPLHREGTAEQVAEAVALLVTNDYITGETLTIDGGLTMRIA
jgi:NAD(P)-dependent dehydrogenase (short-subunit alcohol dehydrogenase family)